MAIPGNFLSAATESMDPTYTGWRPRLNAVLSSGTGGRNGPKVLTTKSVAAGEVQAETVSAYAVVAGAVYQTFADTSGVVAERIGIEWLDASYTPVGSVTWSLTTASASATWHRVGVAGPAPAGAVQARVVLSSTEVGAGTFHYWENVYLGLPMRTTGNLLSFAAESTEIDTSGWVSDTNATVSRQAPMVSWAATHYWAGGHVLAVTAVATGNTAARTTEQPSVTPGVEYVAYCYLAPPSTGSTAWVELRYYSAAGAQLSAARSVLAAASTGYQRQQVSAPAPSNAVSCRMVVGMDGATAGQVLRAETAIITVAPPLHDGTVVPYADGSFEQGVAGWARSSGVAVLARSSPWAAYAVSGAYSLTVTSATATASTLRSAKFPLPNGGASAGQSWRLQFAAQVGAGGWSASWGVRWYTASGTDLGLAASAVTPVPGSGWWLLSTDQTVPAGATQVAVELTVTATAANSVLRLDRVALWEAVPLTTAVAAASSASVTITLRELSAGDPVRVWRVTADGGRTLVRGPSGLYDGTTTVTGDLLVIEDYEAPLLTSLTYRIELGPGLLETRTAGPVTIPHTDINLAWLKDPGNPQRSLPVMVKDQPSWQRAVEQAAYRVAGRRNSVVLSDVRGGREGDLVIWTRTDEERAALHWLLDSGGTLLWQAAPGMGVTDMYVTVGQITEARAGGPAMDPWREWTLPLVEVDMPIALGVNGSAGRTWQDILAEFATWGDVIEAFATWEDVLLNRRKE